MSDIKPPDAARQVRFHQLLVGARKKWLRDALDVALGRVDPRAVKEQLTAYAPHDALQILASAGVRDEHVFPVPLVLEDSPTLIGYYRLLLGVSQKAFYEGSTGMGAFQSMEHSGVLREVQKAALPAFCTTMGQSLAELVRQISPTVTNRDVNDLQLLTIGAQFRGGENNAIGKEAAEGVFLSIQEIVKDHVIEKSERSVSVRNSTGRTVTIILASDPDVQIHEEMTPGETRKKVAIEIKGGTDKSNAYNRAGEAEKSHLTAAEDYRDFWTIIATKGVDLDKLKKKSPTTRSWFDVSQILARKGKDWDDFSSRIAEVVGIPIRPDQSK